jgi:hypothetical protein
MVTKPLPTFRGSGSPWTICFAFVQHPGIKSAKILDMRCRHL